MLSGPLGLQLPQEAVLTLQPVSLLQEIPPGLWELLNHHLAGPPGLRPSFTWVGRTPWLVSRDCHTLLGVYHNRNTQQTPGNCVSDPLICTEIGKRQDQAGGVRCTALDFLGAYLSFLG